MARRNRLPSLLLALAALLCGARGAYACSCAGKSTVLEEYERAGVVVVARVVSVVKPKAYEGAADAEKSDEKKEGEGAGGEEESKAAEAKAAEAKAAGAAEDASAQEDEDAGRGFGSAKMIVERVYKGTFRVGEEMIFAHAGTSCDWIFEEGDVGQQYLFYLPAPQKDQKYWYAGFCGRDADVRHAGDDLLFLNNLRKTRGRTRLSGTLSFGAAEGVSVADKTIRLVGPKKKTYEVKTDEHGVYEIYDLPAGRYLVEPETPPGWKVFPAHAGRPRSLAELDEGGATKAGGAAAKGIAVFVEEKRHAGLDIDFRIDNAVSGKVYDPAGRLMRGVCLDLVPAVGKPPTHFYESDCTEDDGSFAINEIPAGSYLLVVNGDGKISSAEPFGTFYYPNAKEREKAAVISIGAGDFLRGLDIHAPVAAETITVEGRFLYADGKPVADEYVKFEPEKADAAVEGAAHAKTDAQGRFAIKILKGTPGKLSGSMYTYSGEFVNCPKLEALIKQAGGAASGIKTEPLALSADADLRDVELRYPFPGCKKAKTRE